MQETFMQLQANLSYFGFMAYYLVVLPEQLTMHMLLICWKYIVEHA